MTYNPAVARTATSPITEAYGWLADESFESGPPLLDVSQAVPGYPPPAPLLDHLANVLDDVRTSRYGPVLGDPELRASLATDISFAYGADVAAETVAITAGCNQAFCLAITALAGPGDEVILPVPYYFNHDMWLASQGLKARYLPTDRSLVPRARAAAELINERTRAIVLVTPNNPTGVAYPSSELDAFYDLCLEKGIRLVLDETYRDFRSSTDPPHRLFGRAEWPSTLVHLYSFSKVFSITGYRVGGLAASEDMLVEIDKLADCVAICAPQLGQQAALFGLRHLGVWREQNRLLMQSRVQHFNSRLASAAPQWTVAGSGAYFAYVNHPLADRDGRDVARSLVRDHHVLALAGGMFGPGQSEYLRLAFANLDHDGIDDLVDRLARIS